MTTPADSKSTNQDNCSAMLLAAGRGERMRPLTDTTAKPLLKVNGKRLIDYHLEKLAAAGITRVVVNTSWQAQKIKSHLGNGSAYGLYIDYSHEPVALETAGGIRKALHLLGNNPFFVVSADVWSDFDYGALLSSITSVSGARLLMVDNPKHHKDGDFSIDQAGKLTLKKDSKNKTVSSLTNYTYSGIGLYHPDLFRNLPEKTCPLRDVLVPAIAADLVTAIKHSGLWFDVGTVKRLKSLDTFLRNQPV